MVHSLAKITSVLPSPRRVYPASKKISKDNFDKLSEKFRVYKDLVVNHQDKHGFIMAEECDSLLYSSLLSCTGIKVDINSARCEHGRWHRRPTYLPECWEGPGHRGSTTSRDMMLGLMWHLYHNKDLDSAEALYQYAKSHNFVMGFGDPARLVLMPGLESLLCSLIHKLGGKRRFFSSDQLNFWPTSLTGYEVHLLMLHSLLKGEIFGHVDTRIMKAYKYYAKKNARNPLHQYAYNLYTSGDFDQIAEILLDESLWPSDRLPTSLNRSNEWLPARDCDDSYKPREWPVDEFSGGDFLFMAWLILRS